MQIEIHSERYFNGAINIVDAVADDALSMCIAQTYNFKDGKPDQLVELLEFVDNPDKSILGLHGGYGTGKSHLLSMLAYFIGKTRIESIDSFKNLGTASGRDRDRILQISKENEWFVLPVSMVETASGFSFASALIAELVRRGISEQEVFKKNQKWSDQQFITIRGIRSDDETKFDQNLKERTGIDWCDVDNLFRGSSLSSQINSLNRAKVYEFIESQYGQAFTVLELGIKNTIREIVEYLDNETSYRGLLILWDEFGNFVEIASRETAFKPQIFQHIFDGIESCRDKVKLIYVSQFSLLNYFNNENCVHNAADFKKYIERFTTASSPNDLTVQSNLISVLPQLFSVEASTKIEALKNRSREIFKKLRDENDSISLNEVSDSECKQRLLCEEFVPFHPVSVVLLLNASKFCQDRSAATILFKVLSIVSCDERFSDESLISPRSLFEAGLLNQIYRAEEDNKFPRQILEEVRLFKLHFEQLQQFEQADAVYELLYCLLASVILSFKADDNYLGLFGEKNGFKEALQYLQRANTINYDSVSGQWKVLSIKAESQLAEVSKAIELKVSEKKKAANGNYDKFLNNDLLDTILNGRNFYSDFQFEINSRFEEWHFEHRWLLDPSNDKLKEVIKELDRSLDTLAQDFPQATEQKLVSTQKSRGKIVILVSTQDASHYEAMLHNVLQDCRYPVAVLLIQDKNQKFLDIAIKHHVTTHDFLKNTGQTNLDSQSVHGFWLALRQKCVLLWRDILDNSKIFTKFNGPSGCPYSRKSLTDLMGVVYTESPSFFANPEVISDLIELGRWLYFSSSQGNNHPHDKLKVQAQLLLTGQRGWGLLDSRLDWLEPQGFENGKIDKILSAISTEVEEKLTSKGDLHVRGLFHQLAKPPYGLNWLSFYLLFMAWLRLNCEKFEVYLKDGENFVTLEALEHDGRIFSSSTKSPVRLNLKFLSLKVRRVTNEDAIKRALEDLKQQKLCLAKEKLKELVKQSKGTNVAEDVKLRFDLVCKYDQVLTFSENMQEEFSEFVGQLKYLDFTQKLKFIVKEADQLTAGIRYLENMFDDFEVCLENYDVWRDQIRLSAIDLSNSIKSAKKAFSGVNKEDLTPKCFENFAELSGYLDLLNRLKKAYNNIGSIEDASIIEKVVIPLNEFQASFKEANSLIKDSSKIGSHTYSQLSELREKIEMLEGRLGTDLTISTSNIQSLLSAFADKLREQIKTADTAEESLRKYISEVEDLTPEAYNTIRDKCKYMLQLHSEDKHASADLCISLQSTMELLDEGFQKIADIPNLGLTHDGLKDGGLRIVFGTDLLEEDRFGLNSLIMRVFEKKLQEFEKQETKVIDGLKKSFKNRSDLSKVELQTLISKYVDYEDKVENVTEIQSELRNTIDNLDFLDHLTRLSQKDFESCSVDELLRIKMSLNSPFNRPIEVNQTNDEKCTELLKKVEEYINGKKVNYLQEQFEGLTKIQKQKFVDWLRCKYAKRDNKS